MNRAPLLPGTQYHEGVEWVVKKPNIISRVRGRPSASADLRSATSALLPPLEEEVEIVYSDCTAVSQAIATPVSTPCAGAPDAITLAHQLDQLGALHDPVPLGVEVADDGMLNILRSSSSTPMTMNGGLLNFVGTGGSPDSSGMLNFIANNQNGGHGDLGLGLMESSPTLTVQTSGGNIVLLLQEGSNGLEPLPYSTSDLSPESYILVQIDSDGTLRPANQMQQEMTLTPPIPEPPPLLPTVQIPIREEDRPKPFRFLPSEEEEFLPDSERLMGDMQHVTVSPYLSILQGQEVNLMRGTFSGSMVEAELEHVAEFVEVMQPAGVETAEMTEVTVTEVPIAVEALAVQPKPRPIAPRPIQPKKSVQPQPKPKVQTSVAAGGVRRETPVTVSVSGQSKIRMSSATIGGAEVSIAVSVANSGTGTGRTLVRPPGSQMPFKCQSCEAEFQYSASLRKHERTHAVQSPTPILQLVPAPGPSSAEAEAEPFMGLTSSGPGSIVTVTPVFSITGPPAIKQSSKGPPGISGKSPVVPPAPVIALAVPPPQVDVLPDFDPNDEQTCEYCLKVFKTIYNWMRHRLSHEEARLECALCSRQFSTKQYLLNHITAHQSGRQFECEVCALAFRTEDHLSGHVRIHGTGGKGKKQPGPSTKARVQKPAVEVHVEPITSIKNTVKNESVAVTVTKKSGTTKKQAVTVVTKSGSGSPRKAAAGAIKSGTTKNEAVTVAQNEAVTFTNSGNPAVGITVRLPLPLPLGSATTRKRTASALNSATPDPPVGPKKRELRSAASVTQALSTPADVQPINSVENRIVTRRTAPNQQNTIDVDVPVRKRGRQ